MNTKTYPLKIDEKSYNTLKSICEAKSISIKDGLTAAIGLLIAHNMELVEIKQVQNTGNPVKNISNYYSQTQRIYSKSETAISGVFRDILREFLHLGGSTNVCYFSFICWIEDGRDLGYKERFNISNEMFFSPKEIIESEHITLWSENEEFGLSSIVETDLDEENFRMHIPMIDFNSGITTEDAISSIKFIQEKFLSEINFEEQTKTFLLKTDHSFHAYLCFLMDESEYISFLNFLIKNREETHVDIFWAEASIRNKRSCLRWTANSKYYNSIPESLCIINNPTKKGEQYE